MINVYEIGKTHHVPTNFTKANEEEIEDSTNSPRIPHKRDKQRVKIRSKSKLTSNVVMNEIINIIAIYGTWV